jgi:hypothetical protein
MLTWSRESEMALRRDHRLPKRLASPASGACSPFEREVVTFADRPTRGDEDVVTRAGYCDTRI